MAKLSGTVVTTDIKGIREDLSDVITMISPKKTPLFSALKKGKATNTLHEWQTDELAAVDTANAKAEGNDAAFTVPAATVRLGNYCQIADKTAMVSGTVEAVDKAGRKSEMAYQMSKRMAELKRDIEGILFANIAASGTDPRKSAGLPAWIKTNVDKDAGGTNPSYTTLPNATRGDGSTRAVTEAMLKNVIQLAWNEGAEPSYISCGASVKSAISLFAGNADKVFNINSAKPGTIIAAADVYVSNFGTLTVHANRFQRTRDCWVLDFDYIGLDYLRPFATEKLAKTGDAEKRLINVEFTLKVRQEKAHGLIADLS